jgi:hypothetical protein
LATLSNSIPYIPKYNGLQHFESNKIKYAPKSFENKVYKRLHPQRITAEAHTDGSLLTNQIPTEKRAQKEEAHNADFGCTDCQNCVQTVEHVICDGDLHVQYIESSAQSADGMRFVVSVSH